MVKPKLAFLQVEIKSMLREPTKSNQSSFSKTPETFYPIYMRVFSGKFVMGMLDTKVLLIPQIHQSVIPTPSV